MPKIDISINDNLAHTSYIKNGVQYKKLLPVDVLISQLTSQCGIKLPGLMPAGTRYYARKGDSHFIFIEIPPVPRMITYTNHSDKVIFEGIVPMPWALLSLCVKNSGNEYIVVGGSIYALKRPLTSGSDELYHFPAANIYTDHHVCWGSTLDSLGKIKELSELGRLVDYFFSSEFNTDISPVLSGFSRYEDLLRAIKDKKTFPLEYLSRSSNTFNNVIDRI